MQIIKRFFTWFSETFRKQGIAGKVAIVSVSLLIVCCVCSVPVAILSPTTPTPEAGNTSVGAVQSTAATVQTEEPVELPTEAPTEEPTNTPLPSETPEPLEYLENLVIDILGSSNRDVPRLSDFIWDTDSSEIVVTFAGQDNFTDDMITRGIQMDIVDILHVIYASDTLLPYNSIAVVATFPLVDTYGNTEEANVVIATYSRETLDKINWDNFLTDNIFTVADQDTLFLHPALNP